MVSLDHIMIRRLGSLGLWYSVSMKCRYVVVVMVVAAVLDVVLVHMVAPMSVGPLDVLAFFVYLYVTVTAGCYLVLAAIKRVAVHVIRRSTYQGLAVVKPLKLYYYASVIGLAPVILLGMQSIGGVTVWDVSLLAIFLCLACFYIYKRF